MKDMANEPAREETERTPEERYAYYRRCKVLRANGVQCKAPAMKGESVCYSHLTDAEMARRQEGQRRAVLEEAARQMRAAGAKDFAVKDVFADGRAIQKALGVMSEAVIQGSIDLEAAGRLAQDLDCAVRTLAGRGRIG
jgi:hypothetical protein